MGTDFIMDGEQAVGARATGRAPHRPRTIAWGTVTLILGAGLLAIAAGARFSPFTLLISLLGLLGLVALLLAVIPQPAVPVQVVGGHRIDDGPRDVRGNEENGAHDDGLEEAIFGGEAAGGDGFGGGELGAGEPDTEVIHPSEGRVATPETEVLDLEDR